MHRFWKRRGNSGLDYKIDTTTMCRSILIRGEAHLDPEHSVQYVHLLYIPVLYAKESEIEVGADSKGFSLERWGP